MKVFVVTALYRNRPRTSPKWVEMVPYVFTEYDTAWKCLLRHRNLMAADGKPFYKNIQLRVCPLD